MYRKLLTALSVLLSCSLAFALPNANGPHLSQGAAVHAMNAGAPVLPPEPNVFEMIAESTQLSTNLQGMTIEQMVAANDSMPAAYISVIRLQNVMNYINAMQAANAKNQIRGLSAIVNITMIAVGALTVDPMLIAAGIAGVVTSSQMWGPATTGISLQLEARGMPPQVAQIAAEVIVSEGMAAVSMSSLPDGVLANNQNIQAQQIAALLIGSIAPVSGMPNQDLAILSDVQIQAAAEQAALQVNAQGQAAVNQAMQQIIELTEQLQTMSASIAQTMASMVGATKV